MNRRDLLIGASALPAAAVLGTELPGTDPVAPISHLSHANNSLVFSPDGMTAHAHTAGGIVSYNLGTPFDWSTSCVASSSEVGPQPGGAR